MQKNADPVLPNCKNQMPGIPFDEQILKTKPRYTHYIRNKKRISIQDEILYRRYYNDVGDLSRLRVFLPAHLNDTLLNSLHGKAGKEPGISETI